MTQDEIIRMAREAGCYEKHEVFYFVREDLERFARLRDEAMKRRCVEVIAKVLRDPNRALSYTSVYNEAVKDCIAAIMALDTESSQESLPEPSLPVIGS